MAKSLKEILALASGMINKAKSVDEQVKELMVEYDTANKAIELIKNSLTETEKNDVQAHADGKVLLAQAEAEKDIIEARIRILKPNALDTAKDKLINAGVTAGAKVIEGAGKAGTVVGVIAAPGRRAWESFKDGTNAQHLPEALRAKKASEMVNVLK